VLHFTHLDNLPSIAAAGGLACDWQARQGPMRTEVGDTSIKEARRRRLVTVEPGGTVGDYVPFYFAPRSPMMFRIACDCRDAIQGRYQGGDRPLIHLAARVGTVVDSGLLWVATDGNARATITHFSTDLTEIGQMIDWELMRQRMWNSTPDDPDRERRRAAELLVLGQAPLSLFHEVAAYSDHYADQGPGVVVMCPVDGGPVVRSGRC
jgi:hypothetical protein